jgi:hypothetical protein
MRPEPNNDIDLLLRQLSRRNGGPVSEIDEQHLDADELNSYVENALPQAARARYTAHLADCSSCRKLVVELGAAAGPVAVQKSETVLAPSGWKSFLASLFSPIVLRYAVPAVGLMLIAVIGVVVMLRQGTGRSSVAQLNDSPASTPQAAQPESSTSGLSKVDGDLAAKTEESKRQPAAAAAKEDAIAKAAPVANAPAPVVANQPADAVGAVAAEAPPPPKVLQYDDSVTRTEVQKEKKQEARQPEAVRDERAREADKNAPPKNENETVTVTPGTTTRRDIATRRAQTDAGRAGAGVGVVTAQRPAKATSSEDAKEAKDAEGDAEVRSVAGRRFRKSARVWIDTAYDSSKPITTVARGSEQYRALVADEPSIRRIADELDGEIVVVWKGRTYRIR